MSRSIDEIMNREVLAVVPETPVQAIRELLRTFAISAVPVLSEERRPLGMATADAVLDGGGTAADRMSRPAMCIDGSSGIEAAARRLALADAHHIVVVDSAGAAVGVALSSSGHSSVHDACVARHTVVPGPAACSPSTRIAFVATHPLRRARE